MKIIDLVGIQHEIKSGDKPKALEPNITEDCIFCEDGKPVGFYMRKIEGRLKTAINIANKEFRSKNVPKSIMNRSDTAAGVKESGMSYSEAAKLGVQQYSTIIGSVPARPHMRRPYNF